MSLSLTSNPRDFPKSTVDCTTCEMLSMENWYILNMANAVENVEMFFLELT